MTGAERGERSGRGIVQLQSISSPDPPDPPDPPEPPEPPEPFPVPPVASETTSPVTVSLPFLMACVTCTDLVPTVKVSVTTPKFPLLSGEHVTLLFFLSTVNCDPATLWTSMYLHVKVFFFATTSLDASNFCGFGLGFFPASTMTMVSKRKRSAKPFGAFISLDCLHQSWQVHQ